MLSVNFMSDWAFNYSSKKKKKKQQQKNLKYYFSNMYNELKHKCKSDLLYIIYNL